MSDHDIIEAALTARTVDEALDVNRAITAAVGAEYRRPLGDAWNNFGLMSQSGDFDHKIIENVTNAQDAVLERLAAARFGPDLRSVPYRSPQEAAAALLSSDTAAVERRIAVDIDSPGDTDLADKRITFRVRDDGCGMTPAQMPDTILQLGSSHKSHTHWQQGAFGLGAKSTFRNARAVVIVTRRAPEMSPIHDRIAVCVITWGEYGKGLAASYMTVCDWDSTHDPAAVPWSAPADAYPDFEPGTHVALVSYQVRGFHRAFSGDERAFHSVAQTRLHRPVIPFRHTSHLVSKPEPRTARGLAESLDTLVGSDPQMRHGDDTLPFHLQGQTYQLAVDWYVFPAAANKPGGRNRMVAAGHVVVFTSAGQVHHHWDQATFKDRTRLNKLDGRIFAVVQTDELPIELRTRLFTPDRSSLLPNDNSIRLENSVAAFLDDSDELIEINGQLLREEIERTLGGRDTRSLARKISRAFAMRGFNTQSPNGAAKRAKKRRSRPKNFELYTEPTTMEGPEQVTVRCGDTRSMTYWINAVDAFLTRGTGRLEVTCDHPAINAREIAIGALRNGRLRVTLAVPDAAQLGDYTVTARIPEWPRAAGGIGGPIELPTRLTVTDEPPAPPKDPSDSAGATPSGGEVALIWTAGDAKGWGANVPGAIEDVPAVELAVRDDYKDLRKLGDTPIPTIFLNEDYADLKRYLKTLTSRRKVITVDRTRDKYAQGVGVGLLVLKERENKQRLTDPDQVLAAQAVARATLSLLPEFDSIAGRIGDLHSLDDD